MIATRSRRRSGKRNNSNDDRLEDSQSMPIDQTNQVSKKIHTHKSTSNNAAVIIDKKASSSFGEASNDSNKRLKTKDVYEKSNHPAPINSDVDTETVSYQVEAERNDSLKLFVPNEVADKNGNNITVEGDNRNSPLANRNSGIQKISRDTPLSVRRRSFLTVNEKHNNSGSSSPNSGNGSAILSSTQSLQDFDNAQAFNNIKLQLLESQRDKRIYAAAVSALENRNKEMEKELHMKTQQIAVMEEELSRRKGRKCKNNKHVWSQENLDDQGLATYQGILLAAGRHGTNWAKLLVTESYIDKNDEDKNKFDWTACSTVASNEDAEKSGQYVVIPDGNKCIPHCVMSRSSEPNFFSSLYTEPKAFARACLNETLKSPVGNYMNDSEKRQCISRILTHRNSIQKFRAILSDAVGNRKKAAKLVFLRSLGYRNASLPDSKKDPETIKEARKLEKEMILLKCNGKTGDKIDTSFWRVTGWEPMCNDAFKQEISKWLNTAEDMMIEDGNIDNLFMNEAARRAFLQLRGHSQLELFSRDASLLTLARADACMTTMLRFINIGGKGGSRNDGFVDSFRDLLPQALSCIISDIWNDIKGLASHEMYIRLGKEIIEEDPYDNKIREWTVVQINPKDNQIYLLATPKYFKEKVCSWFGNVMDGHIGRYNRDEKQFERIDELMIFDDVEESDVEDDDSM